MIRRRSLSLLLLVTTSGPCLASCSRGSHGAGATSAIPEDAQVADAIAPPSSVSAAPSASVSASAAVAATPPRHHVSLAGLLLTSAYDLPLTDEQKAALDAADAPLYPPLGPSPWSAVRKFEIDLADGIRHTKLDMTKLKADEADVDKAVAAGQAAEAVALNTLHGLLDAATRQTLVDSVKAKRPHDPKPQTSDAWMSRRIDGLTSQLALNDEQQDQVTALLARSPQPSSPAAVEARASAMKKRVDALLADFPKDWFDAKREDLSGPAGRSPHAALDEAATFAAGIVPILKMGQLARFAVQTDRGGSRPEHILEDVGRPSRGAR
jgi:hypothetical protein